MLLFGNLPVLRVFGGLPIPMPSFCQYHENQEATAEEDIYNTTITNTRIPINLHTCIHTYLHTYIPTYIHTKSYKSYKSYNSTLQTLPYPTYLHYKLYSTTLQTLHYTTHTTHVQWKRISKMIIFDNEASLRGEGCTCPPENLQHWEVAEQQNILQIL